MSTKNDHHQEPDETFHLSVQKDRRGKSIKARTSRWLCGNRFVVEQPAITVAMLCALVAGLLYAVDGGLLGPLAAILVGSITYIALYVSLSHSWRLRDRELAQALRNMVQGSHIGLPGRDELSRAFEMAARDIEDRASDNDAEIQAVADQFESEVAALTNETSLLNEQLFEIEKDKLEADERAAAIEADLKALQQRNAEQQRSFEESEVERSGIRSTLDAKISELANQRSELDALRQELEDSRSAAQAKSIELNSHAAEINEIRSDSERLQRELTAEKSAAEILEQKLAEAEGHQERVRELEERQASLEQGIGVERESWTTQRADWAKERESWETERAATENAKSKDSEELRVAEERHASAEAEWKTERAELEGLVQKAHDECSKLRDEITGLAGRWESERRELVEEKAALEQAVEEERGSWESERSEQERHHARVEEAKVELEKHLSDLTSDLRNNEEEVARLAQEGEALRSMADDIGADQLRFFDTISGKLRGPVQIASQLAKTLNDDPQPNEDDPDATSVAERAMEIRSHLRRLDRLIEQVVDLCKLESSCWKAVVSPVKTRLSISGRMADFQSLAHDNRVDLSSALPIDLPDIETDERLLLRTFNEVVSNAIRYTDQGGRVVVSADVKDDIETGESALFLKVTDTGTGVSRSDCDRIFRPFEQADDRPRFQAGDAGVGLGLTLAQRYVGLLGGRIEVDSEPGAGSTFTVVIPTSVKPAHQHS